MLHWQVSCPPAATSPADYTVCCGEIRSAGTPAVGHSRAGIAGLAQEEMNSHTFTRSVKHLLQKRSCYETNQFSVFILQISLSSRMLMEHLAFSLVSRHGETKGCLIAGGFCHEAETPLGLLVYKMKIFPSIWEKHSKPCGDQNVVFFKDVF